MKIDSFKNINLYIYFNMILFILGFVKAIQFEY